MEAPQTKPKKMNIHEEAARCLVCVDAPCTTACPSGDPARAIRAIRFGNEALASRWVAACTDADLAAAEQACIHYDRPIRIGELARAIGSSCLEPGGEAPGTAAGGEAQGTAAGGEAQGTAAGGEAPGTAAGPSLAIDFCGIHCENPFFLASSAVCTSYEMVARAFDLGWGGVFYKTICKQEINEVSPRFDAVKHGTSIEGFRNMEQLSENPYLTDFDILRRLKRDYPTKIVIASIMGQVEEEWIELARLAEEAGCDAVELNFSCPQMRLAGMGSDVGQNLELVTFYTTYVKGAVSIPVIPKMTPNITRMQEPAVGAYFAGADGISAINTIKSITMSPQAAVGKKMTISGYSGKAVKPIAQRYILEMVTHPIMNRLHTVDFSGIGGIETWRDALEFMQLGCRNVQVCTAVMQYGYRIIDDMLLGLTTYLRQRGVERLEDIVGEELPNFVPPSQLDRDTVVYPKIDRSRCMGCGRCYISCRDGGHQAIAFDSATRQPRLIGSKCVGCHLCRLVCPTEAIGMAKRVAKRKAPEPDEKATTARRPRCSTPRRQ